MEVNELIKIVNKWSSLSISHYFPKFCVLITKDMIFSSFGLYQVLYTKLFLLLIEMILALHSARQLGLGPWVSYPTI